MINRSPPSLLREIILVDDASTKDFLKAPLQQYLDKTGLDKMVKIVRAEKREGLIRARQFGAQHATSDVMIFLDSHSEANYNWLPPLLEPIALGTPGLFFNFERGQSFFMRLSPPAVKFRLKQECIGSNFVINLLNLKIRTKPEQSVQFLSHPKIQSI